MTNLYKILPVADVKPEWFGVIVEDSLETSRHSLDGSQVVLKLPVGVQSVEDVPEEWKQDFLDNMPYMNHEEAYALMQGPDWEEDDGL